MIRSTVKREKSESQQTYRSDRASSERERTTGRTTYESDPSSLMSSSSSPGGTEVAGNEIGGLGARITDYTTSYQ